MVKPPCSLFSDTSLWVSSALPKEITLHLGVGIGSRILAIKGLDQGTWEIFRGGFHEQLWEALGNYGIYHVHIVG
jgi:hypothetical protein